MSTAAPGERIVTLDVMRGVAVMGILAMNIVAFAMPIQAYMNPTAFGLESRADLASWMFNFVFVDGKMRGLFSFLFGASALLVIERARASGVSAARVHYARMIWLLVFGLAHFYFIWLGDILAGYALTGLLLFFFRNKSVRALVRWGVALLVVQTLFMASGTAWIFYLEGAVAGPGPDPELVAELDAMIKIVAPLDPAEMSEAMTLYLGPWTGLVHERLVVNGFEPFASVIFFLAETLAYMLLGMAGLKSGFLTGAWPLARYQKWALTCFLIAIPAYLVLAVLLIRAEFDPPMIFAYVLGATTPFRPLMIVATAALIIILTRNGGALVDRIAAAGRAAFTNYLGTSILMTTLFYGYGFGLFGSLSRVELWLVVLPMWALMLLWSKPWLDRFRYGPFEWLWRSLSRGRLEPMRREPAPKPAAA